jgi:hypothetical protein
MANNAHYNIMLYMYIHKALFIKIYFVYCPAATTAATIEYSAQPCTAVPTYT